MGYSILTSVRQPGSAPGRLARLRLLAGAALCVLITAVPGRAANVTSGGDTATPAAGELRKVIQDINGGTLDFPPIHIQVANINITQGALPALTRACDIILDTGDCQINLNGVAGFSGLVNQINAAGVFTLSFANAGVAINTTPNQSVALRRIRIAGDTGAGSIQVTNAGRDVVMDAITITGNRGTPGISSTCANTTMRGIAVQDGGGVDITASGTVNFTSLPRNAIGGGTFPANRLHNYIGYTGNQWWLNTYTSNYEDGTGGFPAIAAVGLRISTGSTCDVNDTDVGNCAGNGIDITPTGGGPNINIRRVRVGVAPENWRLAHTASSICRRVIGNGIIVRGPGGAGSVNIGNAADAAVGEWHNDYDTTAPFAHGHATGDLGVTSSAARGGAGIAIGQADQAYLVDTNIRYVRCGMDTVGKREVAEGIPFSSTVRRQSYGLQTYVNSGLGGVTVDNCQFSGNTAMGVDLNGTCNITFTNNNVGLVEDCTTVPFYQQEYSGGQPRAGLGNGTRGYFNGTEFPSSASGTGVRVNTAGSIRRFDGNVISGSAGDGLVITSNCNGSTVPPAATGGLGDGSAANWNHIGIQGRGAEGGRPAYGGTANLTVGQKLALCSNPDNANTQVAADPATGYGLRVAGVATTVMRTPRERGNGTCIFANDTGTPGSVVGTGMTYQGTGPLAVRGITIADSAVDGLVIDTPQNNTNARIVLLSARIGVDDTGNTPTDQTVGNGTIGRNPTTPWDTIVFRQGCGVRINGDGSNQIGLGSDTAQVAGLSTADRNVISSNLLYGIQLTGNVGTTVPTATMDAISGCRIGTGMLGSSAGTVNAGTGSMGFGNGHVMADPTSPGFAMAYPNYYGAGIRVEPNCTGRHLIGGDDSATASATDNLLVNFPDSTMSDRNVISNNGLVGVWLRGEGSVCVAGNYIGTNANGSARQNVTNIQRYGVLIEQPEFTPHNVTNAPQGNNAMQPQYIGRIPFSGLTNVNADPSTDGGGPGDYPNVIAGNGMWGIAVEDNGAHSIQANYIGVSATDGRTAIPNGADGLPLALTIFLYPQASFIATGGVEIGALNQTISSGDVVIGDDGSNYTNVISGNTGYGVAQYRSGHMQVIKDNIGVDVAGTNPVPNSLSGIYLFGGGFNEILRSLISANTGEGVLIQGSGNNQLFGNRIGVGSGGTELNLGNGQHGILVQPNAGGAATASGSNLIGLAGRDAVAPNPWGSGLATRRNVIAGNGRSGVQLDAPGANILRNNFIGLGFDGVTVVANGATNTANDREGVLITGTGNNTVGGLTTVNNRPVMENPPPVIVDANVIAGNTGNGVLITSAATGANELVGNLVGVNGDITEPPNPANQGTTAKPNVLNGVDLEACPGQNYLAGNVISGNRLNGVLDKATATTVLTGNRIGTNRLGTGAPTGGSNLLAGVSLDPACTAPQQIGRANSADAAFDNGNLISGNGTNGLEVLSSQPHFVYGNRIGTSFSGAAAVPNGTAGTPNAQNGIVAKLDTSTLTLGGTLTGQFNLVSGNSGWGVSLEAPAAPVQNNAVYAVRGNRLGVDAVGTTALGNGSGGLQIATTATTATNTISENRISGNTGPGVLLTSGNNTLTLNRIGCNVAGDGPIGGTNNQQPGILANGGGTWVQSIGQATQGNVISGNNGNGVTITAASGTITFVSNLIGLNVAGGAAIANTGDGVAIGGAATVTVGGTNTNEQNSIAGNAQYGIRHTGQQAPRIVANRVGTNANGSAAVPNATGGVRFESATAVTGVTLGGGNTNEGNVISGNGGNGVELASAHAVTLLGNRIGTNPTGAVAIANLGNGVVIANDAANTIGGAQLNGIVSNVISGNGSSTTARAGILITGGAAGTGRNVVQNNYIGGAPSASPPYGSLAGGQGNWGDGIGIDRPQAATVGDAIAGNVIRDNGGRGINVARGQKETLSQNLVINNSVNRSGLVAAVNNLPLDLDNNGLGVTTANAALQAPALRRMYSVGSTTTLEGRTGPTVTQVEVFVADDPIPTDTMADAANLTLLKHHGGAVRFVGTLPVTNGQFTAALPAAPVGPAAGELVTALAFDAAGDTSEFSRNLGFVNATASTIAISPVGGSVVADNTQMATITVTPRDAISTPIYGSNDVSLTLSPSWTGLTLSPNPQTTVNPDGTVQATVKSTVIGTIDQITATTNGTNIVLAALTGQHLITFTPANLSAAKSSFAVNKTQARSNGLDAVTLTITARDLNGMPFPNLPANQLTIVATPSTGVTLQPLSGQTDANGQLSTTAVGSVDQTVSFSAYAGNAAPANLIGTQTVAFIPSPIDIAATTFTAAPTQVASDNTSTATLTLTVRNVDGQPVSTLNYGTDFSFAADAASASHVTITPLTPSATDRANGVYQATVRSDAILTATFTATVQGQAIAQTAQVQFVPGEPSAQQTTMTVTPSTAIADGTQAVTVQLVVLDTQGRPVPGRQVTLSVAPPTGVPSSSVTITQPAVTDANGAATGSFTAQNAGTYQVSALVSTTGGTVTIGPKPVIFTANPPDATRSTVSLSPTSIVADGTASSTLTLVLVDAQGRKLSGVTPQEVTIAASPATGVNIIAPTSASDANGQMQATITGTQPGTVTFTVTARGVQLTQQPQLVLRDYWQKTLIIGTHMVGIPVEPLSASPDDVFGSLVSGLRMARWVPSTQSYLPYSQGTTSTVLQVHPGKGFWLQLPAQANLRVVGTRTPDGPFDLATEQGWNQLGNPYTGPLAFRLDQIQVLQNQVAVGPLTGTAARALVDAYAWVWDPVLGYLLVVDPSTSAAANVPGTINEGAGFWMNVKQPGVTLRFAGPTRAAGSSRAVRTRAASPAEWMLSVQASAGGCVSQANLLGASSNTLTASLPPESPQPQPVRLAFVTADGRAVAADVRQGPLTRTTRWVAKVDAPADTDVTLSWQGINRALPANHRLWLVDPTNGKRTLMNSRASYTYHQTGTNRQLYLEVDPRGQRSLVVSTMNVSAGSSRSRGVPIDYTVSVPATVHVVVKGFRGTVVRTLTGQATAGQNTIGWDRLDDAGRPVPSGVYQVELTATTDEGEIARLTRTVRVP